MALRTYRESVAQAVPVGVISDPVPQWGADFFSDTSAHNGTWHVITALTDAVVDLTSANWGGSAITAVTIKAGTTIRGWFPYIKLASGTVVAYRAEAPTS